ncbi:MAG TPA: penicillin-binding protein 2 [Candidatus Saccharimonadales bacterium]|nr:penicillin-binding protein 2 [Candidatus Saccharimonadales bacterium]
MLVLSLFGRLFYWQIVNYNKLAVAATSQHLSTIRIDSPRGRILSSDGNILAGNQKAYLLYALIPDIKKNLQKGESYSEKVDELVKQIEPILFSETLADQVEPEKISQKDKETLEANLINKLKDSLSSENLIWVPLFKKLSAPGEDQIKKLKIKGLGFEEESERFYPEGSLASSLVGFVGKDSEGNDQGYFGLEGFYQDQLQGQSATLTQEVDASGQPILSVEESASRPKQGLDIETTIDRTVQYTVEKYLQESGKKFGAKNASVIVMDPKTGAILALANYPNYDPGKWNQYSDDIRKNNAIADVYEPGSTFKGVTGSIAINSGAVKPDTICPCTGPIKIDKYQVETWNNKYNPNSNMAAILEHSDNIGAAFWAQQLGKDKFIKGVKNFGFGSLTGVDLQGEETGLLKARQDWGDIDLVTGAFGQGLSVTALQLADAYAVIANGGKLMKPYVVSKVITKDKEIKTAPVQVREIIKKETAEQMQQLLLSAVEQGEAKRIIPKGMRVAGKTGTAQIPLKGQYDPNKTVASFVGFGPIEDPKFVMVVKYVEPKPIYGAETAEPTFFKIASELYNYWGIPTN